jgi:mRNA-degrading endonuclease RelE of RelBE toxin-antitoxin system
MVGRIFRVLFTKNAQRRRGIIDDFETKKGGKRTAAKIQRAIDEAADRLEKLPGANPGYLLDGEKTDYNYTKAFGYKLFFKIFKKIGEVLIITIRHDNEDPDEVDRDLP